MGQSKKTNRNKNAKKLKKELLGKVIENVEVFDVDDLTWQSGVVDTVCIWSITVAGEKYKFYSYYPEIVIEKVEKRVKTFDKTGLISPSNDKEIDN